MYGFKMRAHTTTAMIFRGKYRNTLELVISDSYGNHGPFCSMILPSRIGRLDMALDVPCINGWFKGKSTGIQSYFPIKYGVFL
jgi:hypothetical protein